MPLAFMLQTLRDEAKPFDTRMQAAKDAAPYVHPKLATIDAKLTGNMGFTVNIVRHGKEGD